MESRPVRERVLEGGLVCIGRYGLARTTVDDVAHASGVSRATIYRHFPGRRAQIAADTLAEDQRRYFRRLGAAAGGAADLCLPTAGPLVSARKAPADHGRS